MFPGIKEGKRTQPTVFRGSRPKELDRSRTKLPARNRPIRLHVVPELHLVESMLVAVRASFWRPVLPVTFAAMPYNAARLAPPPPPTLGTPISCNFRIILVSLRWSGTTASKRAPGQWRCPRRRWVPHKMGPCSAACQLFIQYWNLQVMICIQGLPYRSSSRKH